MRTARFQRFKRFYLRNKCVIQYFRKPKLNKPDRKNRIISTLGLTEMYKAIQFVTQRHRNGVEQTLQRILFKKRSRRIHWTRQTEVEKLN